MARPLWGRLDVVGAEVEAQVGPHFAVDQPLRTVGVEMENPVTIDMEPDTAERRRVGTEPVLRNHRQRKQTRGLIGR